MYQLFRHAIDRQAYEKVRDLHIIHVDIKIMTSHDAVSREWRSAEHDVVFFVAKSIYTNAFPFLMLPWIQNSGDKVTQTHLQGSGHIYRSSYLPICWFTRSCEACKP